MTVRMAGAVAHLHGDWTMTGVADNIESMIVSLGQLEAEGKKNFWINCKDIEDTDTSGLQLLIVWMECARLRGIEPKLVNVPDGMLRSINDFGFSHLFTDTYPDVAC